MNNNLKNVVSQLGSDKVRERQEALETLKTTFARDSAVLSVDPDGKGRAWLAIFQALFTLVDQEKKDVIGKGSLESAVGPGAAARRRLGEAASTVRWLAERSVHRMNSKVIHSILDRLVHKVAYRSTDLLAPVALDFLKAIRCVVSFHPHLDHLKAAVWVDIVRLTFNIVLGDPLNSFLDEDDSASAEEPDDADGHDSGDPDQDQRHPTTLPGSSRKRLRPILKDRHSTATRRYVGRTVKAVSPEQVESMTILSILLRSNAAPFLSQEHPRLPEAILSRFRRFIDMYPSDSSLYHDCLHALSATLGHIALNKTLAVHKFASDVWGGLVELMATKNKKLKESLLANLKVLFPYLTMSMVEDSDAATSWAEGVGKLWQALDTEIGSRRGLEPLPLDAIRLQLALPTDEGAVEEPTGAFVAHTFRYGREFSASHALTWAVLELQADCLAKLLVLSESMRGSLATMTRNDGKRARLQNPIATLLVSIQNEPQTSIRTYRLQLLLFFIDRHWMILHADHRGAVLDLLNQYISIDDAVAQSWVFLTLAAIAYAVGRQDGSNTAKRFDQGSWDAIWTHLVRRANVALICRAACHAGYTLLQAARHLVSPQCVLSEIELLARDLDVQGPTYPSDSVCAFLGTCLKIASQDMRLFRMQLEEKVLSWLIEVWRVGEGSVRAVSSVPSHTVDDVLSLLQTIRGVGRRAHVICRILLPDCLITHTVIEEQKCSVIRDYLLDAHLPRYSETTTSKADHASDGSSGTMQGDADLSEPRARDRRISTFLLKLLEDVSVRWGALQDMKMTAERARRDLDLAAVALIFEHCLVLNGFRSNRRVIQAACRVVSQLKPLLTDSKLTDAERLSLVLGLEPLALAQLQTEEDDIWETMLPAGEGTGIKREILRRVPRGSDNSARDVASRRCLQRLVWQSSDVQDAFAGMLENMRIVTRAALGCHTSSATFAASRMLEDEDDFAETYARSRMTRATEIQPSDDTSMERLDLIRSCTLFLSVAPTLQSSCGEPTRDKELSEIFLQSGDTKFLAYAGPYFHSIRMRTLTISVSILGKFLDKVEALLIPYLYSHSERLQVLVIQFLGSTSHIWLDQNDGDLSPESVGGRVLTLCRWLQETLQTGRISSWKTRDHIARFLDGYLSQDPTQRFWRLRLDEEEDVEEPDSFPTAILPTLCADKDVRVRFRAAVLNARLFRLAYANKLDPLPLYTSVTKSLCTDLGNLEHMLTRLLCLGNIMVVSSAVRRGSYWHLLETCLYTVAYNAHVKAVLLCVSERMGLPSLSQLFEAYASQIAYSIRQGELDFLRLPPHLLGYTDRRACAEATFLQFSPTNLLAGGSPSTVAHGKKLFANHCKAILKTVAQGIWECFPDIIGHQLVFWVEDHMSDPEAKVEDLRQVLLEKVSDMQEAHNFDKYILQRADCIIAAILRTVNDPDFSQDGSIVNALRAIGDEAVQTFQDLSHYRSRDAFPAHEPNLPSFSATTILHSLKWLLRLAPQVRVESVSYHLMHQLFSDIQRSPLLNEQKRLINGILIWVAAQASLFRDMTLLRTFINGSTILLCQSDLARAAQSMLEWAFGVYIKASDRDPRFPNVVVRISCIAHDYMMDSQDRTVSQLGSDLLQWIEGQTVILSDIDSIRPQVLKALPAWPREPSAPLGAIYDTTTGDNISSVLADHRMLGNKFRLVRRLRDSLSSADSRRFAISDFWRLKECIPSPESIQDKDAEAFAELLFLAQGRIESFANDQPAPETLRTRHQRYGRKKDADAGSLGTALTYRPIILALLSLLDSPSPSRASGAYRTLRLLISVCTPATLEPRSWSTDIRGELRFLQAHPVTPRIAASCQIQDLMAEAIVHSSKDFPVWITTVTKLFCDVLAAQDRFFAQLCSVVVDDVEFAEQVLPVLIHTVLEVSRRKQEDSNTRTIVSEYLVAVLSLEGVHTSSLRAVVDVILHLRHFSPDSSDALAYDKWLELDYTLLSQSCLKFGAYTTALLFLELAIEYTPTEATAVDEQVLYEIYSRIDEPDGFYGIKTRDLHQFLLKRFHHEHQWDKAFKFHGASIEAGAASPSDAEGIIQSLHSFGFHHMAIGMPDVSVAGAIHTPSSRFNYDLGWRTETWDLPEQTEVLNNGAPLYKALRAVHRERDQQVVNSTLHSGLRAELERLRGLGDENLVEIREVARNLMCLSEVCRWRTSELQENLRRKKIDLDKWSIFHGIHAGFDFTDLESIMATRVSLLRSAAQREQRELIGNLVTPFFKSIIDIEKKCLVRLSAAARDSRQLQVALNSVIRAQRLEGDPSLEVSEEFAHVLWLQNEQKLAVQLLQEILGSSVSHSDQETLTADSRAVLLARLGTWTSEACLQKPTDILSHYFDPAVAYIAPVGGSQSRHSSQAIVYQQCAMFAERQYSAISKSDDALRWKVYMDRKIQEIKQRKREMEKFPAGTSQYNALARDQEKAEKLLRLDEDRWKHHQSALEAFIQQAVDMHSRYLEASDDFDDDGSIRLCSLWFANFDNVTLQPRVRSALDRVASRKFVFLAHQLSARLSKNHAEGTGQSTLRALLIRMCKEHPFHSLYQVYCLRAEQAPSQSQSSSANRRHSARHESPSSQIDRASAATDIFDRLREDPSTGHRIERIESLCNASLQWAKYPIKKNSKYDKSQKGPFQVPDDLLIRKIQDYDVPVMTAETPIDPTMQYSDCIWINKYESTFETAGGVNLPKIINCIGSDGERYKQLFKGEGGDDLRQDAVMEQVFDLVNIVLRRDVETRKRDLNVRGYKVIPLASQAGVIQFVKNTTPLQSWLFAAHIRYRPEDMSHKEVHSQLVKKRKECGGQAEPLVDLFLDIRKRFRPVMRHYFTEKHKNPMSWFSKRLNYTRSVATTSIVGHILGLGDRHTSNILLDNSTGQVVHIDLGIAFDQGKLLPVPERVPFRMTADMVDGMGMSGTQGVFQRCAEETLRVLRDGSEVIMTVLEVFKYDPLHSWTASELKIKRIQGESAPTFPDGTRMAIGIDMTSGSADEAADRALTSVAKKLDKSLSVEYTVNDLIAQATDPVNLATIFPGWGPHY